MLMWPTPFVVSLYFKIDETIMYIKNTIILSKLEH